MELIRRFGDSDNADWEQRVGEPIRLKSVARGGEVLGERMGTLLLTDTRLLFFLDRRLPLRWLRPKEPALVIRCEDVVGARRYPTPGYELLLRPPLWRRSTLMVSLRDTQYEFHRLPDAGSWLVELEPGRC